MAKALTQHTGIMTLQHAWKDARGFERMALCVDGYRFWTPCGLSSRERARLALYVSNAQPVTVTIGRSHGRLMLVNWHKAS